MLTIDMIDMRNSFLLDVQHGYAALMSATELEIGAFILGFGIIAGGFELLRRYWKGKGYRMALKERQLRIREILTTAINDTLFDLEYKGDLSSQEINKIYTEFATKLELYDLVPKQRRLKIVKNEIKGRLHNGAYKTKPEIPGKPAPIARPKFRESLGNFASKFWRVA